MNLEDLAAEARALSATHEPATRLVLNVTNVAIESPGFEFAPWVDEAGARITPPAVTIRYAVLLPSVAGTHFVGRVRYSRETIEAMAPGDLREAIREDLRSTIARALLVAEGMAVE